MTFWELLTSGWTLSFLAITAVLALWAAAHVILTGRDPRNVILWVWCVTLIPILGPVFYYIFGINRIRRAGSRIRESNPVSQPPAPPNSSGSELLSAAIGDATHLVPISTVLSKLNSHPLTAGNQIEILINGDQAYPAMLDAIRAAEQTVAMSTYIFEWPDIGERFAEALVDAKQRGVEVRVIIDDFGTRYSWPSAVKHLAHLGIPVRRFMPKRHLLRLLTLNLRNHRKLLITDGTTAFTGGMNIRAGHLIQENPNYPVQDVHFRLRSPIVGQCQHVFVEDWKFCDGEILEGESWFPDLHPIGNTFARGIAEGPDLERDVISNTILAALSVAQKSVVIATPYFLPPSPIVAALNIAAMRGVDVSIVLPAENNIHIVRWASRAGYRELLEQGCKIYESAPPFDHAKIFVVDDRWSLIGSTNWDPRSLHLNYEFNVACFDPQFAGELSEVIRLRINSATPVSIDDIRSRSLPVRLRDGIARLFTPGL